VTVLVTGGAGYIGSHMVHALVDAGRDVVVLDDLSTGFRWALPRQARLVVGDIGDQALVERLITENDVVAILHFAGSIVVPDSIRDPLGYYLNNTVKTRAVLAAAVTTGVGRFVFSSTAAVYGTPSVCPVNEDAPTIPLNPYGASKLMSERMLADTAAAHDFRYIALRYFNVAGADPAGRTGLSTRGATHLLKIACETALGQRPVMEVYGTDYPTPDGTGVRDYIHVSDLVVAHLLALEHLERGGSPGVFNCGYGRGFSVLEVIEAVRRVSGHDFPVVYGPRRPGDAGMVVADSRRLAETLGWRPRHDRLETIVAHALAWEDRLSRAGARDGLLRADREEERVGA
jgi:UDP-glucose 4-epimerase